MKKIHLAILSIALLTAGISSCSKTSTKKVSNEWKVTSYESTETQIQENGDKLVTTQSSDGSITNSSSTSTPASGTPTTTFSSRKVEIDDFKINKDGTWSWDRQTSSYSGETVILKLIITGKTSGTWNFAGKSKEEGFKKNERIIFHTLKGELNVKNTSTVVATGQTTVVNEGGQTDSYLPGENVSTYTVVESKKDELQLAAEGEHVQTQSTGTVTNAVSFKMTLTKK